MAFEISGKLHKKFDTEQKTDTFKAREFVIATEGDYPQFIKFQCTQDRCAMIDGYEEGSMIKVSFDLRGREWQGKYFTNLNAWKIAGESGNTAEPEENFNQDIAAPKAPAGDPPVGATEDYDDLPF